MKVETDMENSWDDSPCLDHHIFFIDLIVVEIVMRLQPADLIPCRLLTISFSYSAERWIEKTGWFHINFKYSFQCGTYVCAKPSEKLFSDLDSDWESSQIQGQSRSRSRQCSLLNQNTLASLSEIMEASHYFPFKKFNFLTKIPKIAGINCLAAVDLNGMRGILPEAVANFLSINYPHENPNLYHLIQHPLSTFSFNSPNPVTSFIPYVILGVESYCQDQDSSPNQIQSPIEHNSLQSVQLHYISATHTTNVPLTVHNQPEILMPAKSGPSGSSGKGKKVNMKNKQQQCSGVESWKNHPAMMYIDLYDTDFE